MADQNSDESLEFNSRKFITLLFKWQKHLMIIAVLAAVLSFVFSSKYFITPLYKSKVVMFPASTNSLSKVLLSQQNPTREDLLGYGEMEQAEQMMQILNSSLLRTKIINKYHLLQHYNIDPHSPYKQTELFETYKANIRFARTEFMAVEAVVFDRDAQTAADIANDIAAFYDTIKNNIQHERTLEGLKVVKEAYDKQFFYVKKLEDSLTILRKMGVNDYESQSQMFHRQLAMEVARNNKAGIDALEAKLEQVSKLGSAYVSLRDALSHENNQLSYLRSKLEEIKVDAEKNIPQKFIVDKAYTADKKSYPIRWLIVLVSTAATLILAVLIIILIENNFKKKIISRSS